MAALISLLQVACTLAFAWLITQAITGVVSHGATPALTSTLLQLGGVIAIRALLVWANERVAAGAASRLGTELRSAVAAERLAWPVYQRATTVDDAVVLRTQSRVIRVLSGASMRSGVSPEQAAEVINGWIDSARPGH